jgi:hypothetical protein
MARFIDIEGFERYYQISPNGEVKSLARTVVMKDGRLKTIAEKIIRPYKSHLGYLAVCLHGNGYKKKVFVSRLVAHHFIKKLQPGDVVNHINFDISKSVLKNTTFSMRCWQGGLRQRKQ